MTLNVMALIFRYFTEFVYDMVVVKQLLGLTRFQSLLLIVYDHLRNYSVIVWAKQTLIIRFDGRRCIDDQVHGLAQILIYGRNQEVGSMAYLRRYSAANVCDGAQMAISCIIFCVLYFQRATCSSFQTMYSKFALRPHHVWKYDRNPVMGIS